MPEYIKREDIKYELWSVGPLCEPLMVVRKKTVDSIPAAVVAPVVRCKDCGRSIEDGFFCKGIGFLPEHPTLPNKWCSEGYRKDGDG